MNTIIMNPKLLIKHYHHTTKLVNTATYPIEIDINTQLHKATQDPHLYRTWQIIGRLTFPTPGRDKTPSTRTGRKHKTE